MRTRSSFNLPVESSPNPKRRNRRHSKQPFILEESPVDTMADQRTIVEFLRAPTEGYAEAIVVPPILAGHFELKHNLINMMTSDQFFRLEKENAHDHIRCDANSSSSTEIAKLTHAVNQQTSVVTTAMTAILKQFQATSHLDSVNAVEEIYVTCGGAHLYYQCLTAGGNTFLKLQDNIQGYVSAAAVNYNQEIEYLLNNDPIKEMDSILEDSVDEDNLADLNDNLADTMPKMFTNEHAFYYSSLPLYDEYDDDLFEVEFDTEYVMMIHLTLRERKSKSLNS
nr:reverse transcriptase domain-containing protein [Tanacetum cinerariifolium]